MDIFVISLLSATARRAHAKGQLNNLGLTFSFFDALSPKDGADSYFKSIDKTDFMVNTGRELTAGEIGCYASHLALWRKCVELQRPIMIMEDDFMLADHFPSAVSATRQLIGDLGYIRLQNERRAKRKRVQSIGDYTVYYYTKMPHSAMCYAITPKVAAAFIEQAKCLNAPIDVMVKKIWQHRQRLYGLSPYPVDDSPHSPLTSITGRTRHRKPLAISATRFCRKISDAFRRVLFTAFFQPPTDNLAVVEAEEDEELGSVG